MKMYLSGYALMFLVALFGGTYSVQAFRPASRTELKNAVNSWVSNREEALRVYEKRIRE